MHHINSHSGKLGVPLTLGAFFFSLKSACWIKTGSDNKTILLRDNRWGGGCRFRNLVITHLTCLPLLLVRRPPQRRPLEQQQQQHEPAGLPRQHARRRKLRPRPHTELLLLRDPPSRQIGEGTIDWCTWRSRTGRSGYRPCAPPVSWSVSTALLPLKAEHLDLSCLNPNVRHDNASF